MIRLVGFFFFLLLDCASAFVPAVSPPRAKSSTVAKIPHEHPRLVVLASTQWDFNNNKNSDKDSESDVPFASRKVQVDPDAGGLDLSAVTTKLQDAFKDFDFDLSGFQKLDLDSLKNRIVGDGNWGERGEAYFAAQAVVMLCVLLGGVPVVGDAAMLLLGPGLLLAGLAVIALSFRDLGDSLSPWPVPASAEEGNTGLKTDGLYAYVRHPMYAGLLAACAGLSIVSGSAVRLLLTAVLLYVLEVKSDYEEGELVKAFGSEYERYRASVTNKFFPQEVLDKMPWMNKSE
jgi:protein-S-isoprenylcysteine O-methyltransferase Ste14